MIPDSLLEQEKERARVRLAAAEKKERETSSLPPTAKSREVAVRELHWARAVYGEWFVA